MNSHNDDKPTQVGGLRLSDAEIEFMANEMAGRLGEDSGHMEDMLRNLLGELCRAAPAGGDEASQQENAL